MKRIFITGSGGFIGKNLKSYLESEYEIFSPRSFELDLKNAEEVNKFFARFNPDFVIHCAAIGGVRDVPDEEDTLDVNLAMFNNILNAKKQGTRVITFGSGAMYDKKRNLHKVRESELGEFQPKDLYGLSKLKMAEIVKDRDDVLMLNIFACYGFDEKPNRFPSYAILRTLENKTIEINQNAIFDYLWVEDMEKIVAHFIENEPKEKIMNITPAKSVSLLETAKIVSNGKVDIIIKNPVMNFEYTGDNSLLLREMPSMNFTPIEAGLQKLYEYNKNRLWEFTTRR